MLFVQRPIEPISHPIRAWVPLGKAQRIEEVTYESPALPLSYSAVAVKLTEHELRQQPLETQPRNSTYLIAGSVIVLVARMTYLTTLTNLA